MISSTLNQYKESFKTNLLAFLNEYEDNTKIFFLQNEKIRYQAYQKALTKIADQMRLFTTAELDQNLVQRNIALDLKKININAYNSIITELYPIQDENIFKLSAAKKDRIKINQTALQNHIKSSIVILKFISDEKEEDGPVQGFNKKNLIAECELEKIVADLWTWQDNYEKKVKFLNTAKTIEEKADYVVDSYKNYEERYLKHQLENCNIFLEEVPNDKILIDCKKRLEIKLIELRLQFPLPPKNIDGCIDEINNAFYRLELFMKGKVFEYRRFFFNDAFTLLMNELNKFENINIKYDNIGSTYWNLMSQLAYAYDKGEYENQDANTNDDFNKDCNEIDYIQCYRIEELTGKFALKDYKIEVPSIIGLFDKQEIEKTITPTNEKSNPIVNEKNPYPKIFKDYRSFTIFNNLLNEFGNTSENLSNYSFVFHKMTYEDLIHFDIKQQSFFDVLDKFDITISRIKPLSDIGKIAYRESIYAKAK